MYLTIDGYNLEYIPSQNRIVIGLPQTHSTIKNTALPVEDRKNELSENDLVTILYMVVAMCRGRSDT